MKELDKSQIVDNIFIPKEGQRELLSSNRVHNRCPSLVAKSSDASEDILLDYLANILVEAFLDKKEYERKLSNKSKESSNLLSSVD